MKNERRSSNSGKIRLFLTLFIFLISISLILGAFILPFFFQQFWTVLRYVVIGLIVIDIILGVFLISSSSQIDFKISRMTVILCLPIAGPILYLIFSQKETKRTQLKRKEESYTFVELGPNEGEIALQELKEKNEKGYEIAKSIYDNVAYATYKNSKFEYYKLGELGFPKMVEALKNAKRFIFFEYYIIERGDFFNTIYEILKEKAKAGVEVRFIYDDFGSSTKINPNFYLEARKDGIKCFRFNRIRPSMDVKQNNRDHRKILIIDGVVAFSGGCNIADEYINKIERFGIWKDNIFMVKGRAVDGYLNIFLQSWNKTHNDLLDEEEDCLKYFFNSNADLLETPIQHDGYLTPYGEVPLDNELTSRDAWLSIINSAKEYVYISTPYLIPDSILRAALETKAKQGVKIKIVTPGIPDKKMVFACTRSFYSDLMMAGVEIYEYTPGFNHAKIIVSDDDICSVGTVNMDFRSFYAQYECSLLVINSSEILKVREDLDEMILASKKQELSDYINISFFTKIYWGILRIISPFF